MAVVRGNNPTRVDEKGRLKVPTDFKRRLDEDFGETEYFITSRDGERAEVYPLKVWEELEAKMATVPSMNPARKKFEDVTNYYGQQVSYDNQGRLLLPQLLRQKARLEEEVVVIGKGRHLEVVNRDRFEVNLQDNAMTAADMEALAALGI
jgi:MraZ protein